MDLTLLKYDLKSEEGFVSHAYQDHKGYWTIGIGRLIDERKGGGITEDEADYLLDNDIKRFTGELEKRWPHFKRLSERRQRAILMMAFQMGVDGVLGFDNMIKSLEIGHYDRAVIDALDSKWARIDTPERAGRVALMLK